jgi:CBS domain-containing protein
MPDNLSAYCVLPDCTIHEVITLIDKNEKGIVLVTDENSRLLGTITDGDVRRAILAGKSLGSPVRELLAENIVN